MDESMKPSIFITLLIILSLSVFSYESYGKSSKFSELLESCKKKENLNTCLSRLGTVKDILGNISSDGNKQLAVAIKTAVGNELIYQRQVVVFAIDYLLKFDEFKQEINRIHTTSPDSLGRSIIQGLAFDKALFLTNFAYYDFEEAYLLKFLMYGSKYHGEGTIEAMSQSLHKTEKHKHRDIVLNVLSSKFAPRDDTFKKSLEQSYFEMARAGSVSDMEVYLSRYGVSGQKTHKQEITELLYMKRFVDALQSHSIKSYMNYINNYPQSPFISEAKDNILGLYRQQKSFDGYMQAYKFQGQQSDLLAARNTIKQSSTQVKVDPSLAELYFTKMVVNKISISDFFAITTKMDGISASSFIVKMLQLPDIQTQFTHDSFFDSIEYKYLLKNSRPKASVEYKLNEAVLVLKYEHKQISINKDANCEFSKSETNTRDRGFIESLVTFNGDDKQTSSYDIYYCQLSRKSQSELNDVLHNLDNYLSTASITQLNDKWEASQRTSSYSYSTYIAPSSNSSTANSAGYNDESISNSSSSSNSSSNSTSSNNNRREVKRIANNGKVNGVNSWRVECSGGTDYIIYHKSGTWYRGGSGHMGNKYDSWSKEQVGAYLCE